MSAAAASAAERIGRLLDAMRRLVEPSSLQRRELCARLVATTGLSAAGVELGIDHCLELTPSASELAALMAGVPAAPRAHVSLPSNVFVAAHRALALALAAAPRVFVKPSRREPALIEALLAAAPELFTRVDRLEVEAGDHVWAYGSDATLGEVRRALPRGAVLHAHGAGFGVALVDLGKGAEAGPTDTSLHGAARAIARDTVCFDQRGCLSPRFVLVLGDPQRLPRFGELLAQALAEAERSIPCGRFEPAERAQISWYRECAACFGSVLPAGQGGVSLRLEPAGPARFSASWLSDALPSGRHLEVLALDRLGPVLSALEPWLTTVGCADARLEQRAGQLLAGARIARLGHMQTPPFDGPVDLRSAAAGEIIGR
jgi:hypothetical protein